MKLRLALLALPFLGLACTDAEQATLLEPPAISADVTIQAAPVVGTFTLTVFVQPNPCSGTPATFADPDWTLPSSSAGGCILLYIDGYPAGSTKRGVVVHQQCISKSTGNHVSRSECANKTGGWKTLVKKVPNPAGVTGTQAASASGDTEGWRLKFQAKGSGIKNMTIGPFDIINPA